MKPNYLLSLYDKCLRLPLGRLIFSRLFAAKAPYFKSIKPRVTLLEPNRCEVLIRKRKSVQNHIGTMHAIAICNGLEMAMGGLAEASIPGHLRWIPKSMTVDYLVKAATDITAIASTSPDDWQPGDLKVKVEAKDLQGVVVVSGFITIWVSEKPAKKSAV